MYIFIYPVSLHERDIYTNISVFMYICLYLYIKLGVPRESKCESYPKLFDMHISATYYLE